MNQKWIIGIALFSLSACGSFQVAPHRRSEAPPPPPAAEELAPEDDLRAELTGNQETPPAVTTPAPVAAPLESAPAIDQAEMSIFLKDKNGKIVQGAAPSTIGGPAPAITEATPGAKAEAVSLPPLSAATAANPDVGSAVPGVPLVTDEDFEISKASQRIPGKVKGDQAVLWLKNGNRRFVRGHLRKDGQSKKDIRRLTKGEEPHSAIFTSSDSRMPPEVIFDQKLGEIYVVRNAGPVLDAAAVTSLEYAVEQLGVNLVVVMGNTDNRFLKASLQSLQGHPVKSPSLRAVAHAMHHSLRAFARRPASKDLKEESWTYASSLAQELAQKSALLKAALDSGSLKLQVAVYDVNQGSVEFKEH